VLEHLEKREGGDVDLLGGVEQRRVRRRLPHAGGAEDPLQPLHRRLALLSTRYGWVRSICLRLVRKIVGWLPASAAVLFLSSTAHLVPGPDRPSLGRFGAQVGFCPEKERTGRHRFDPVTDWLGFAWAASETLSTFGPQFYSSTTGPRFDRKLHPPFLLLQS